MTPKVVNDLETKEIEMTATQYIAIAALTDYYLSNHRNILPKVMEILDSDGKNYVENYSTSFRADSLLKRWFEDFVQPDYAAIDAELDDIEAEYACHQFCLTLRRNIKFFLTPPL